MLHKFLVAAALAVLASCSAAPKPAKGLDRCIWIDRWDWTSAQQIEQAIEDCHQLGFTAVIFQVRGNGTVLFPSRNEVWSEKFGHKDPGFDPLATAIEAARRRGMELHAWLNMAPGWVGDKPAADQGQLWNSRQAWFLRTRDGATQKPEKGKYLALNLCLPEVRSYLVALCAEVVTNYEIDGLHIDYIRFPDPEGGDQDALGVDSQTLSMFSLATGKASSDEVALRAWQADCVTTLVRDISTMVRGVKDRKVTLSASVFADPVVALRKVRQDWGTWAKKGYVDMLTPMNYTPDDSVFARRAREEVSLGGRRRVVVGVGAYMHKDPQQTMSQLRSALAAGARGVGVFNYRTLFGKVQGITPDHQAQLRDAIATWFRTGQ